ncbi:MobC family plasmid mobilization relaxosome protein [Agrobacterium rosae]|uniref:Bacterial mobilisation protein (MobC) n=1 Tax=Agrobacterium rosae TaxID=1972867 RepID=A0A1R3U9W0_9HYPH|nr:MobC family plasmid mobilization relaxosome protein [Agrobacterium rosae]SCX35795.1 Bacterial mobilisation protein (MobC) [Agrobacterium rosae]
MSGRNGQELLSTWVPADLAAAFKAQARSIEGGASAALRRLVFEATTGEPGPAPKGAGSAAQVGVRLKAAERAALAEAALSHGTSPANWLRSLALVHLVRQPQWNAAEIEELRSLFREVRAIGNNVNQIAHALNIAVQTGQYPPYQGAAAREAAELVRYEMRRIVAVMSGNFDYWGLPDEDRPSTALGAAERESVRVSAAEGARKRRPRRRLARFSKDE